MERKRLKRCSASEAACCSVSRLASGLDEGVVTRLQDKVEKMVRLLEASGEMVGTSSSSSAAAAAAAATVSTCEENGSHDAMWVASVVYLVLEGLESGVGGKRRDPINLRDVFDEHGIDAEEVGDFVEHVKVVARVVSSEMGNGSRAIEALEVAHKRYEQLDRLYAKFDKLWGEIGGHSGGHSKALAWYLFVVGRELEVVDSEEDPDIAWSFELLIGVITLVHGLKEPFLAVGNMSPHKVGECVARAQKVVDYLDERGIKPLDSIRVGEFYTKNFLNSVTCFDHGIFLLKDAPKLPAQTPLKERILSRNGSPSQQQQQYQGMPPPHPVTRKKRKAEAMERVRTRPQARVLFDLAENEAIEEVPAPSSQSPRNHQGICFREAETPVSLAVEASNWLARQIRIAPPGPGEHLARLLRECPEESMGHAIQTRIEEMRNVIAEAAAPSERPQAKISRELFDGFLSPTGQSSQFEKHLNDGTKLYYFVLDLLLKKEVDRLNDNKVVVVGLLGKDMFHRALFALCMEIIFRCKEIFRLMHPTLTDALHVPGLELLKVLTGFIEYVPMLPRMLKEHLSFLESDILEENVWRNDSPVFELLKLRNEVMKQEGTNEMQKYPEMRALNSVFINKLLPHAHAKTVAIYMKLKLGEMGVDYRDVWEIFRCTMKHHAEICKGRHLDQVILCSIFGVCKLNKQSEVTFKRLVEVYKECRRESPDNYAGLITNMSRNRHQQYANLERIVERIYIPDNPSRRQTRSGMSHDTGNIVDFYNYVFIFVMKETILNLKINSRSTVSSQPVSPANRKKTTFSNALDSPNPQTCYHSKKPVSTSSSSSRNVVDMTPNTKKLFAPPHEGPASLRKVRNRLQRNPMEDDDSNQRVPGRRQARMRERIINTKRKG